jgi:predicted PolB exonuclease-like 3'-5' exonuclease
MTASGVNQSMDVSGHELNRQATLFHHLQQISHNPVHIGVQSSFVHGFFHNNLHNEIILLCSRNVIQATNVSCRCNLKFSTSHATQSKDKQMKSILTIYFI